MKTKIARVICIVIIVCGAHSIINNMMGISSLLANEPNEPPPTEAIAAPEKAVAPFVADKGVELPPEAEIERPRKIVMPRGTKLPPRYKCPVHGIIDNAVLNIEVDGKTHVFCKRCAMLYLVDFLNLNLPKLEQINIEETKPEENE